MGLQQTEKGEYAVEHADVGMGGNDNKMFAFHQL